MIDSKKLAATPLTEFEPGSNEYYMAIACHLDNGETPTHIGLVLNQNPITIGRAATKGREIRDRLIKEASSACLQLIRDGEIPPPRVKRPDLPKGATNTGKGLVLDSRFFIATPSRMH